jgi:hypothetical protein
MEVTLMFKACWWKSNCSKREIEELNEIFPGKFRKNLYFLDLKEENKVVNGVRDLGHLINIMINKTKNNEYYDYKDFINKHSGVYDNMDIMFTNEKSVRKAKQSLQKLFNNYLAIGGTIDNDLVFVV